MTAGPAFRPGPLERAIERANGREVGPLVCGVSHTDHTDDAPTHGIPRGHVEQRMTPHPLACEPRSNVTELRPKPVVVHDWANEPTGTKLLTSKAGDLAFSLILAYCDSSGVQAVVDASAEVRRGIQP